MSMIKNAGVFAAGTACALIAMWLLIADTPTAVQLHRSAAGTSAEPTDEPRPAPNPLIARRRQPAADDEVSASSRPLPESPAPASRSRGLSVLVGQLLTAGVPPDEMDPTSGDPAKQERLEAMAKEFLKARGMTTHQLNVIHQRAADEWFHAHRSEYNPIDDEKTARGVQRGMVECRQVVTSDGKFYVDANDNPSETYRARRRELQQKLDDQVADLRARLRLLAAE